jgi:hypothetical protein
VPEPGLARRGALRFHRGRPGGEHHGEPGYDTSLYLGGVAQSSALRQISSEGASALDYVAGAVAFPSALAHLGEGTGNDFGDPSSDPDGFGIWRDVGTASSVLLAGVTATPSGKAAIQGPCGKSGPCFVAGTPVQMADGSTRPIEQVEAGESVFARDEASGATGRTEAKEVVRTFRHTVSEIVVLEVADAATGKMVATLRGTPTHPFFVEGKGFVALGALGIGTRIVSRAGPALVVKSTKRENYPNGVTVYNVEVEGYHTYFVGGGNGGNGGAWVHNDCVVSPEMRSRVAEVVRRIRRGEPHPYGQDGTIFGNREGLLPAKSHGYYREYTVPTPGLTTRGARRVVVGDGGEIYLTTEHYRSFVHLNPND